MRITKKIVMKIILLLLVIFILTKVIGGNLIEGKKPTLESFVGIHFSAYLFFLLMPAEMIFIYYLSEGQNQLILFILALFTAISAQIIDYMIGYAFSKKVIDNYIGIKKYEHLKEKICNNHQNGIIFLFNLSFLSSPIIALVGGIMKVSFKRVLIYSFLGLFLKYLIIIIGYRFFM